VDDNITNLEVAKGLMKPYGMNIDCVTGGQEAIDAIRSEEIRYNAIFMDHMMPGMDGMEATRLIREIDTDYAKNIPIIALTANAIVGNEELFLSKGFQAFLSKPIDIYNLDEVIHYWVRDKKQEELLFNQQSENTNSDNLNEQDRRIVSSRRSGIDRRKTNTKFAGLDINKGIERFGGDEETYLGILRSYVLNTRSLLESLENVSEDNLEYYAGIIHAIKGASYGILANMIGNSAEALESAAKTGDYKYIRTHNHTFLDAAWKLISDLEEMLSDI
jgi:CheY-like chemotaxis protein